MCSLGITPAGAQSGTVSMEVGASILFLPPPQLFRSVSFGTVTNNGNAGTVTLDEATGAISFSGGVRQVDLAEPGEFSFTAPIDGNVAIFPSNPSILLQSSGSSTRSVVFAPATTPTTVVVTGGDVVDVFVGGELSVGAGTDSEFYFGSFSVTIAYV